MRHIRWYKWLAALGGGMACGGTQQGKCVLETSPSGGLPYLRRMAALEAAPIRPPAEPLCTEEKRGVSSECEAIDDLAAIEGTGKVCGPGGVAAQQACPRFESMTRAPPAYDAPPCGVGACPNVALVIDGGGETVTRVTFYDDPSCHGGPTEAICEPARHACHYRLLTISTELKGKL